jgi:peptidoglycan/LPS O-acetylase OafA/YrhL
LKAVAEGAVHVAEIRSGERQTGTVIGDLTAAVDADSGSQRAGATPDGSSVGTPGSDVGQEQRRAGSVSVTLPALDGVRALACLFVLGFHISLMTRDMHIWTPGRSPLFDALMFSGSTGDGNTGVTLFFVLSGFLLFLPYVQALMGTQPCPSARQFYLRRAWRILPGYYASLFLLVTLQQPQYLAPSHWHELVLFLVCFMDSTPATFQQLNGPYWTLAIEWQFYLMLPLIALALRGLTQRLARRVSPTARPWSVAACLVVLMVWGVLSRYWGGWLTAHPTATCLVLRRVLDIVLFFTYDYRGKYLEDFACGMLAGICYVAAADPAHTVLVGWIRRFSPWLGCSAVVAYALLATDSVARAGTASAALLASCDELALSLCFASAIVALLLGARTPGRIFEWTPLRWIGLISYSLYIWHLPLLFVFMRQIGPSLLGLPALLAYGLYWTWAGLVVVPFAASVYWLVERPGMRMGNRARHRFLAGVYDAAA